MNMIQSAKDQIAALTRSAYRAAVQEGLLPDGVETVPAVEIPKDTANGDYTTTFCLAASKAMHKNPREVAAILTQHMDLSGTYFTSVAIAGPGFLNFRLGEKWYADVIADMERETDDYGRGEGLKGKKIMVEFVSANPTGPMHMGNARGGVLGDTLASVLDWSGADVWREFYVNDFGNQIEKFAKSIEARYFQIIKGEDAVEFPEDGYHGDDIKELAQAFYAEHGESYMDKTEAERHADMARFGLAVREDSENPVYYIQYAYARICSLLKTMADEGRGVPAADKADLSLLSGEQERALIKELANFSEEIRMAARDYDPSYINRYLLRLAGAFHRFYNACRIKGEADDVANARLLLAAATRQVLANGLGILGLSKPEKM